MKKNILILSLLMLLAWPGLAQARLFTINYTAFDTVTDIYAVVDQGAVTDLADLGFSEATTSDPFTANTWTGNLAEGSEYTFYFRIEDTSGAIALLADITGPNSYVATNTSWRTSTSLFSLYPEDAVEWTQNDGTFMPQVAGIDALASWISNGPAPGDDGEFGAMYLGVSITDTPIPAALWLMGSGLLAMLGIQRLQRHN